jgi:hypothetical protein
MADFAVFVSQIAVRCSDSMPRMTHRCMVAVVVVVVLAFAAPLPLAAQTEPGLFARIAILRPHDGETVDFEAGYIRHLDWHRRALDPWTWYGWTVTFGDRQRWFVYASFGHSAASFDSPVSPSDDERDNVSNVTPHAEFAGNALYEFLPALSRGTAVPSPAARLELTTVDVAADAGQKFESMLHETQSTLREETLWYRLVAGGTASRYVRLRPRPTLSAVLEGRNDQALPGQASGSIAKVTIDILTLRPTMSLGLDRR